MAKKISQKVKAVKKAPTKMGLPLTRENYIIFAIGLGVIVVGYIFLSNFFHLATLDPNSFWSRTLAPIFLVIGYCIIIPLSLLYRKKDKSTMGG